jgi:hypothetical protein
MNSRVDAFASLADLPAFEVKPKAAKPLAKDAIDRIAEDNKFPSRQAPKSARTSKREPRLYRTGRNRHFGVKATNETVERFYKMADERKVTLGGLLEMALDALERAGASSHKRE